MVSPELPVPGTPQLGMVSPNYLSPELPGECRLGRDIHGFLSRYPSFVNLVAVTNGTRIRINVLRINDLRSTLISIRFIELYITNTE